MTYTEEQIRANREAYLAALESGEYTQAREKLTRLDEDGNPVGHCCLGVACEVALANGVKLSVGTGRGPVTGRYRTYDDQANWLPKAVVEFLGLDQMSPVISLEDDTPVEAVTANDSFGKTFVEIAAGFRRIWQS